MSQYQDFIKMYRRAEFRAEEAYRGLQELPEYGFYQSMLGGTRLREYNDHPELLRMDEVGVHLKLTEKIWSGRDRPVFIIPPEMIELDPLDLNYLTHLRNLCKIFEEDYREVERLTAERASHSLSRSRDYLQGLENVRAI